MFPVVVVIVYSLLGVIGTPAPKSELECRCTLIYTDASTGLSQAFLNRQAVGKAAIMSFTQPSVIHSKP